ncbi:MAG: GGDEF domain-containing protein [Magnetococcales bacterium]|nr:GGDEF domain-containing protein [Magnetococcales bacterium]
MKDKLSLQAALDFIDGKSQDREQARKAVREALFKKAIQESPTDERERLSQFSIKTLTLCVKPLLEQDTKKKARVEDLARKIHKKGLDNKGFDQALGELRTLAAWLRELELGKESDSDTTKGSSSATEDSTAPLIPRLIENIRILGEGAPWLEAEAQQLLNQLESESQAAFIEQVARFCTKVTDQGPEIRRAWEREQTAFLALVTELAGHIREMRETSGETDSRLGGAIGRLHRSKSLTDLETLRAHLIHEAQDLKDHSQKIQNQLQESQERLSDAERRMEEMQEELDEVKAESLTDPLTKIPNRRALDQVMNREFARSRRYHLPLTFILFDLDHFKRVNDDYGHPVGDKVLVQVAAKAKGLLRQSDFLARYGGEEFALILPGTSLEAAIQTADKIRGAISRLRFKTRKKTLSVTASFGASALPSSQWQTIPQLLKAADVALYQAKQNGRNRVEVAQKAPPTS